ncbi:aminoglycoside phosphotransferase family protein [Thalassomonas sp. M1454]|uniref:aminoglycoside phosphotransferase family protein n=1 Tax=Thalassomonas sp. M1454 TaxID=2594477 RepID=UPI00117E8939|nr:phosphotransferase [Thalassomonas sp. M1454]TRX54031.1 phosphotransferase [Thalassomonas sp. M1454]
MNRNTQLSYWLQHQFPQHKINLTPLSGDAGFRCYYRLQLPEQSYIVVDAPPEKLNNLAFVELAKAFSEQGLVIPEIIAYQVEHGFMCLTDFGDCLLADKLTQDSMFELYRKALALLPKISNVKATKAWSLPIYDAAFLQMEMEIFIQWLLGEYLNIELSELQQQQLQQCFDVIITSALEQPQVTVHRDFHSRNLMLLANNELGVIDFQDAVIGPITYDLVSLLRDCYVRWDDKLVAQLIAEFWQSLQQTSNGFNVNLDVFKRWVDLMGIQRHIKASGIFARLYLRDNKPGYLADIPLTLSYLVDIADKYPELKFISELVSKQVLPALNAKLVEDNK